MLCMKTCSRCHMDFKTDCREPRKRIPQSGCSSVIQVPNNKQYFIYLPLPPPFFPLLCSFTVHLGSPAASLFMHFIGCSLQQACSLGMQGIDYMTIWHYWSPLKCLDLSLTQFCSVMCDYAIVSSSVCACTLIRDDQQQVDIQTMCCIALRQLYDRNE